MAPHDATGDGGGGSGETSVSPTSRVKFFCSYAGRILPRPSDGVLKYVGGETRVVAVSRTVSFSELMKKMSNLLDGDFVIKYQVASEDLDSLVSVKSDEDLRHMLDEYDRLESEGQSKLRTFLFPSKPTVIETGKNPFCVFIPQTLEQRYVDAINGLVRTTKSPLSTSSLNSSRSSPESASPHSLSPPCGAHNNSSVEQSFVNGLRSRLSRMQKVHSSPSLSSHNNFNAQSRSYNQDHPSCHYSHGRRHQHCHSGCQSPHRLTPDHSVLHPVQHMVRADYGKANAGMGYSHLTPLNVGNSHPFDRPYPGSGGRNKWAHLGGYAASGAGDANNAALHLV